MPGFTEMQVPSQSGRTFVVTGANAGLGFEIARILAARGGRVLLGCRDAGRAADAITRIRALTPAADCVHLPLDLADLDSVRRAAEIAGGEPRLDALINNAGVMLPPLTRTAQGHELQFGVNHLATFALSALLLPVLTQTAGARIVATSSLAHKSGAIDWDDIDSHRSYKAAQRYSDSKLMNLLFAFELDRRLRAVASPVSALACHPGVAATELARHAPAPVRALWPLLGLLLNTAAKGAWPALQAATDPGASGGDYYGPQGLGEARGASGPAKANASARDPVEAARLWDLSIELTGIDPGLPSA